MRTSPHSTRTRIKICGLTRAQDVHACAQSGADALGFVFYPPSKRFVSAAHAAELCADLPAFISTVALFVNPEPQTVKEVIHSASKLAAVSWRRRAKLLCLVWRALPKGFQSGRARA